MGIENMVVSVDRLPIRRINAIEENGIEHYPPRELSEEERYMSLLHGIDFSTAIERDAKKLKKSKEGGGATEQWPWQNLVENLRQAQQEVSVIIDLINNVEANDAVAVAGMTRPKQLPGEVLSDFAVSTATKLQSFRHMGKYLKQSAKALRNQVEREARFYGALSRLQQNWKVKRQRALTTTTSEGFTFDLADTSTPDQTTSLRQSSASTVRLDHDPNGMLTIQVPSKTSHAIQLGFLGSKSTKTRQKLSISKNSNGASSQDLVDDAINDDDINKCIKDTHSVLRDIHRSMFDEMVFELVNREALYPNAGVYVAGLRENFILFSISQEYSVSLRLLPLAPDTENLYMKGDFRSGDESTSPSPTGLAVAYEKQDTAASDPSIPCPYSFEIYLQQLLHESVLRKEEKQRSYSRPQGLNQSSGDVHGLLGNFCLTLAHRIFSKNVLLQLDDLVATIPYVSLLSHPTWSCRTSSWSVFVNIPQRSLHQSNDRTLKSLKTESTTEGAVSRFHTRVEVRDECIKVIGEGGPHVAGLFAGDSMDSQLAINECQCDLMNLPLVLLQQIASQVLHWLHVEAIVAGVKVTRRFLSLSFELEQREKLSLVAHLEPDSESHCLTWWLILDDAGSEEAHTQIQNDFVHSDSENRRFLGHLSLEQLYALLMDSVGLCAGSDTP